MEDWLLTALVEKRKVRALTETARQAGIEPTRLSRIANQYVDPSLAEVKALTELLRPAVVAAPVPVSAPTPVPAAVSAPAPVAVAPPARVAAPAQVVAAKPAVVAAPVPKPAAAAPSAFAKPAPAAESKPASVLPKPMPASARLSFGLAALKVPVKTTQSDFVHRQELLKFIFAVRDWPAQHEHPLPGDFAYLQTLWNEAQKAIDAVNRRLYGEAGKPLPQPSISNRPVRRHHSTRFLFMQVAEERLPLDVVANIRESAQEGLKGGAAQGFLEAFHLAAEAILDEEDFNTLTGEAKLRAETPEE
jgi:hypothetical protein